MSTSSGGKTSIACASSTYGQRGGGLARDSVDQQRGSDTVHNVSNRRLQLPRVLGVGALIKVPGCRGRPSKGCTMGLQRNTLLTMMKGPASTHSRVLAEADGHAQ